MPAGIVCTECRTGKKAVIYQVTPAHVLRATAACLVLGVPGGMILAYIGPQFGLMGMWPALLLGLLMGELALSVTGRKRAIAIQTVAGVCTGLGMLAAYCLVGTGEGSFILSTTTYLFLAVVAISASVARVHYY